MAGTFFGILGTLEVRAEGTHVELKATQLRRLLAILLLSPGRQVQQDSLIEWLWPGDGDFDAQGARDPIATLRVYASRLRRLLPEELGPHGDQRGYRLDVRREDIDAGRFEALLGSTQSGEGSDPHRVAATLAEALGMWRGPALAEFRDETWAVGTAVRLDELRLVGLERLYDARLSLGEHRELCGELESLLDEHPLRERLWAQLMTALYRSGRQVDALRAYRRLRELLVDQLGIEPSRELVELEAAVLRQDPALDAPPTPAQVGAAGESAAGGFVPGGFLAAAAAARSAGEAGQPVTPAGRAGGNNLPVPVTSFVGRQRESAEVRALVGGFRLVTLTGPGGAGKTRLAVQVAADIVGEQAGAVWLVELAPLAEAAELDPAVASVLGIKPRAGAPVRAALLEALRDETLLLLLDNCEHLVTACAGLCDAILRSCAGVSVLATSREPLGVDGEVIYRVLSLGVPAKDNVDPAGVAAEESVQLFSERARMQQPSFQLDAANAATVASLCRRLDGIPLALELAAARLRALSLTQIHDRLDSRFRLLVGGSQTRLPRQQTLQSLIDWSYDLLEADERWLLRRLGVFSGGFDLEAAEALVGGTGGDEASVLDELASLVDKSLLVAETSGDDARYRLLETIRQYALDRLEAEEGPETVAAVRDMHAGVFLALAERSAPLLTTPEQFRRLARLDLEADNLRTALGHLLASPESAVDAMRLIVGLARFLDWRGNEGELLSATELLEARGDLDRDDPLPTRVLLIRSRLLGNLDPARAMGRLEETLSRNSVLADRGLAAEVLNRLAWLNWSVGDYPTSGELHLRAVSSARESGEYLPLAVALNGGGATREDRLEALALSRSVGDSIGSYMALCNLGALALDDGDVVAARRYLEEALPVMESTRPGDVDPPLLVNLGSALVLSGDYAAARPLYARALEGARRHLDERQTGYGLFGLALCASGEGEPDLAATLHGATEQQFERAGFALEEVERRLLTEDAERLRKALGDEQFEAARAGGKELSKREAIDLALGSPVPVGL